MGHAPRDLLGTIVAPVRTMERLSVGRHGGRAALPAVLFAGLLYAASSAALALAGAVPAAPVPTGLGPENYYFWQMLFALPFALAAWGVAGFVMARAGRPVSRDGTSGGTAACAGFGVAVPLMLAWVPSGVQAALMSLGMSQAEWVEILSKPGWAQTAYLTLYLGSAIWSAALLGLGAGLTRHAGRGRAALAGVAAGAVLTALFGFLIR